MKTTRHLLCALLAAIPAVFGGCNPEVVSSDTFEASFKVVSKTFHGGEDFVFRVYSNHDRVILTKYDCEFASDAVILNKEYSVTDGFCEFREKAVTVDDAHRGRISVTVKDPDTGATMSFSDVYEAYLAFDNYLRIENSVVNSSKVLDGYPCVIGGDDFVFTVHSNLSKLTLKDFVCEFNDGQLVKGKEYAFNERGDLTFTMKKVKVTADRYETPQVLSLKFLDALSGEDIVLEAGYVTLQDFKPGLTISPSKVTDGGDFKFRITSNRKNAQMTSLSFNPSSDESTFRPSDLYGNTTIQMNADGYKEYTATDIIVGSTHNGKLTISLRDHEYTGREVTLSASYSASVKPGASNITLSETSLRLNYDDTGSKAKYVTISTTDTGTDGEYSYKFLSGSDRVTVTLSGNQIKLEGSLNDGETKIQVYPTNNPKVTATLTVYVRKRVALIVSGAFRNHMQQSGDGSATPAFSNDPVKKVHNWHRAPESMYAGLVTWSNQKGLNAGDPFTDYHFTPLTDTGCNLSADFYLEYTYNTSTSIQMFAGYRTSEETHWTDKASGGYYYQMSSTRPNGNQQLVQSIRNVSSVSKINLATLTRYLQDYDDVVGIQTSGSGWMWNVRDPEEKATEWKSFGISVRNLSIDENKYDLRDVIYEYRTGTGYWWSEIDQSHNHWVVHSEDL